MAGANNIKVTLTPVKLALMDALPYGPKNQAVVEKKKVETFADRFERLRAGMSYQALSEAIHRKTSVQITAQAMHQWVAKGWLPSETNMRAIAEFFGVREAWLRYGEGQETERASLEDAIAELPDGQQVIDFIEYKIGRAEGMIASDKFASYMAMIDRLKKDRAKKDSEK